MTTQKRVLPALLLSLFAGAAPSASAATVLATSYVFGDSLSDAGYFRPFLASLGPARARSWPPSGASPPTPARCGPKLVSNYYGATAAPSNVSGGNIYAQGGARVALSPGASTPPGTAQRPVSTQIDEYLAHSGGAADPGALYTVWAGANDIFYNLGGAAGRRDHPGAAADQRARGGNGRDRTGRAPHGRRRDATSSSSTCPTSAPRPRSRPTARLAGCHHGALGGLQHDALHRAAGLRHQGDPGRHVLALRRRSAPTPATYGFTNTTSIGVRAVPADHHADHDHVALLLPGQPRGAQRGRRPTSSPTASTRRRRRTRIIGAVRRVPDRGSERSTRLIAEAPLRSRARPMRSRRRRAGQGTRRCKSATSASFVGGDGGKFRHRQQRGQRGPRHRPDLTASSALTMRALGIGDARHRRRARQEQGELRQQRGQLHAPANTLSVVSGDFKMGGFYGNGVLSHRQHRLHQHPAQHRPGPLITHRRRRTPNGNNASAYFSTGYDFTIGKFLVGPTVVGHPAERERERVRRSRRRRRGPAHARRRIASSEVWSLGVRASYDFGDWTPWVRVTADKERRDDERLVSAVPLSMIVDQHRLRHSRLQGGQHLRDRRHRRERHHHEERGPEPRVLPWSRAARGSRKTASPGSCRPLREAGPLGGATCPRPTSWWSQLADHGIRARIFNANASSLVGELPIEAALPQVWVDDPADAERARETIEAFVRRSPAGIVKCPACGEDNPASFDLCWSCQAGLERLA